MLEIVRNQPRYIDFIWLINLNNFRNKYARVTRGRTIKTALFLKIST